MSQQELQEMYSSLPDERLVMIALRGALTPDAEAVISRELQSRGISDLSSWKKDIEHDVARLEAHREVKIEKSGRIRAWTNRLYYGLAALLALYGLLLIAMPSIKRDGDGGGLFVLAGVAFAGFIWVRSKLQNLWSERVLHRRWWR